MELVCVQLLASAKAALATRGVLEADSASAGGAARSTTGLSFSRGAPEKDTRAKSFAWETGLKPSKTTDTDVYSTS